MDRRTILYVVNTDTPDADITTAAEAAAQSNTRLVCLLLNDAPALPMHSGSISPYGSFNVPDNWSELMAQADHKHQTRVNAIEGLLAQSNVSGDVQSVICATTEMKHNIARSARVADEVFVAQNLRDTPDLLRETAAGVLFHSPVGLRINGAACPTPNRVVVAWDSSTAAASALHAALPYLIKADEVMIACIDPITTKGRDGQDPGTDVAAWLSHHGCSVNVAQFPSGGAEIADCLQHRAQEFGADLVVMGGYGHSRAIQMVFGGTTRTMMAQNALPLFLAH